MKRLLLIFAFVISIPFPVFALDVPVAPTQYILDNAEIFSAEFETKLIQQLTDLEEQTSAEIGILTIPTLEDEDLAEYANKIFRAWGIGQDPADNGLLILISSGDHQARIEVGYGLEGRVTDANALSILTNLMVPSFKEGDYETGVQLAIDELSREVQLEAEEEGFGQVTKKESPYASTILGGVIIYLLFSILGVLYGSMKKEKREKIQKSPILPLIAFATLLFVGANWIAWLLDGAFALILHTVLAKGTFPSVKKRGGKWWNSGGPFSGGSGGGSGGSGGFGGGSSGGGGSSSSW
ncbi:TPM domain-containing protein [Candidatus Uhrbacteria bacterium]|nr:TPM domain-containing protein [Candidatus Uhrbacteria bacterium]